MTVTDASVTWLTQEAYDRLKAELEELIDNRPVIAAEINARREEGDLKENGGYHAAREEQGQQEARIRQLQELLRTAQVGTAPSSAGQRNDHRVLTSSENTKPRLEPMLEPGSGGNERERAACRLSCGTAPR